MSRGARFASGERKTLAKQAVERYAEGESIRQLAESTGRSYGLIRTLLRESGVKVRRRGGRREKASQPAANHAQLVATLARRHPGRLVTPQQAVATLREVHGVCAKGHGRAACMEHNKRMLIPLRGRRG